MAILTYEDYDSDSVEKAKKAVVEMTQTSAPLNTLDLFYTDDLSTIENGIKQLNEMSSKCWILSAIALYTLVYDKALYQQSGMDWQDYQKQAKDRLGLDPREVSEQLSGARFFIANRIKLINYGWNTSVPRFSLARGYLALELSGDLDETIKRICTCTVREFKEWYQSFKCLPAQKVVDKHPEITIKNNVVKINKKDAVIVSKDLPQKQREQFEGYLQQIVQIIKSGNYPAIVSVYDSKEATVLNRLRDKYRQGK